ncbi:MAG: helix-turn-helix domain-containing protein [Isosphaeraceae bacterium]
MDLSKRIRDLRYAKGWGPDELASRAKISRTALYQIERGNTSKPQAGTLRRISRALGVPLESLLDRTPLAHEEGGPELPGVPAMAAGPAPTFVAPAPVSTPAPVPLTMRSSSDRAAELMEKFRILLASPMAEGIARIVEESFRLLPIIPPSGPSDSTPYVPAREAPPARRGRSRSRVDEST